MKWRDAKKEWPEIRRSFDGNDEYWESDLVLMHVLFDNKKYSYSMGQICECRRDEIFREWRDEEGNSLERHGYEVLHWCYQDDIPKPE